MYFVLRRVLPGYLWHRLHAVNLVPTSLLTPPELGPKHIHRHCYHVQTRTTILPVVMIINDAWPYYCLGRFVTDEIDENG